MKKNHYACRGGNFDTVDYLLKEQTGAVSERNSVNKLPIHLMCEHGERSGKNNSLEWLSPTLRWTGNHGMRKEPKGDFIGLCVKAEHLLRK